MLPSPELHQDDEQPNGNPSPKNIAYSPRIASLDVLRGIAVLGALFVSVWILGGFSENQQMGLLLKSKGFEHRLFGTVNLLFYGKMASLICIVFGASMLLFLSKDNEKGAVSMNDLFIRRQMWLMLFGIINAIGFLWTHDYLFHLAIAGILLFPFTRLGVKGLVFAALIATVIYSGKFYWDYSDHKKSYGKYLALVAAEKKIEQDSIAKSKTALAGTVKKDTLTKKQKEEKQAWEGIVAGMKYDKKKDEGNNKAIQSHSYAKVWNHLLPTTQGREARWMYQYGVWELSAMILLGMALFKMRFFTGRYSNQKMFLISLAAIAAGLILGWFRLHFNQLALQDYAQYVDKRILPYQFFYPFEMGLMGLGYSAFVISLLNSRILKHAWSVLGKVGRMALTTYLMQSIICGIFFTGVGMGYYGRMEPYELYFVVIEIILVQSVFAVLWLRYYMYGPAEWLLRCLIRKKWLPIKTGKIETPESPIPLFS